MIPMKKRYVAAVFAAVMLVVVGGLLWNAVAPIVSQYFNQVDAANEIEDRTSDAQYAQEQHEWFQQQKQDIDAIQRQIENQRRQIKDFKETHDMDDLSYTEQRQYNRMTNRLLGYQNQYERYVADYNARMNVSYMRQYNDSLPLEMEKKFWTGDLIP